MTIAQQFRVHGLPVPQGSMKGFVRGGHVRLTSANDKLKPWRESVKSAAIEQNKNVPMHEGPLLVNLHFFMPRPKSYSKKITEPFRKPDLDKLVRGVFDALTEASIWRDDSLVVILHASKRFADDKNLMGCEIKIWAMGS